MISRALKVRIKRWNHKNHLKYFIATIIFAIAMLFGDNSFVVYLMQEREINTLKEKIETYKKQDALYKKQLELLENDPQFIEKMAREKYLMKKDNEDIYIFKD